MLADFRLLRSVFAVVRAAVEVVSTNGGEESSDCRFRVEVAPSEVGYFVRLASAEVVRTVTFHWVPSFRVAFVVGVTCRQDVGVGDEV
jgi:hypothetical protein